MKILYVTSRPLEINTSASIRNRATIKGLVQIGHDVDLITTQFDTNHSNYDDSILKTDMNVKVKYLYLGGVHQLAKLGRRYKFAKKLKHVMQSILLKFEVYDNLKGIADYASRINVRDGQYDMIISSSDPKSSHLLVSRLFESGAIKTTPWIQIWGDPFLSDATRNNRFLNFRIKKEEERLLKYATKVIYVSNLTLKEQQEVYFTYATKMFYVPIPYLKEETYPTTEKDKDSMTFLYSGDYSSNIRDIKPLYDAIQLSKHQLIICGSSDKKLDSAERIKIYPRVSFEKTRELEVESDVLVHLSNSKGTQIPGKIYQYSGTNKPILFILDGNKEAVQEEFEKYQRYIFCDNNIQSITSKLDNIYQCIDRVLSNPIKEFSPPSIAQKIVNNGE